MLSCLKLKLLIASYIRPPAMSHGNGRNETLSETLTQRLTSPRLTWRSSCSSRPSPPAARRSGTPAGRTWWSRSRGPWSLGWLRSTETAGHVLFWGIPTWEMFLRLRRRAGETSAAGLSLGIVQHFSMTCFWYGYYWFKKMNTAGQDHDWWQ